MMTIEEMINMHSGVDPEKYALIKRYVMKFKEPWATMGPQANELILHCIEQNKSLDDLPEDDPMILKYFNSEIIY